MAVEIKKRGRLQEVVAIVKESIAFLRQIDSYLTERDLIQITSDLKMVIGK